MYSKGADEMNAVANSQDEAVSLQAVAESYRQTMDFPKPGVRFYSGHEISADARMFRRVLNEMETRCRAWMTETDTRIDYIAGFDARGFIFGSPISDRLNVGFLQPRKPRKLPPPVVSIGYDTEYGTDTLEMAEIDLSGKVVVLVDDLLATGGTARAGRQLVENLGGTVGFILVLFELPFLNGKDQLSGCHVEALFEEVDEQLVVKST